MTSPSSPKSPEPCGVIAIITSADGYVIAAESDFERQTPGGFKLWDAQRIRAADLAASAAVKAYCNPVLANSLDPYLCLQIWRALREKGKYRMTFRAIGYPEDVQAELDRRS